MAIKHNNSPECTICGAIKREVNHWWLIVIGCMGDEIHFVAWSAALEPVADGCACGEACAHKALARWFETRTLEAPPNRNEVATTERTA
jgi:hypothetical protein